MSSFRLVRYFSTAALLAFLCVGGVLFGLEYLEVAFFQKVQDEHDARLRATQREFTEAQQRTARRELMAIHEAGHVTLARVLGNALWAPHFAPLIARLAATPGMQCKATPARRAAWRNAQLRSLPEFARIDRAVAQAIRGSKVFKIKVFDTRGLTLYSSEPAQVGEDKSENAGWRQAVAGTPASELTHRDRFSAFEGVVENRDLISTYIPITRDGSGAVTGVFEIYSDVTPFLNEIALVATQHEIAVINSQHVLDTLDRENRQQAERNSALVLVTISVILLLLYLVMGWIVRNAQNILDAQARAAGEARAREKSWHQEKMSALSALAANVAHETNNPLATLAMLVDDIAAQVPSVAPDLRQMHQEISRIAQMTRRIAEFADLRGQTPQAVDLNAVLASVCGFLGFDSRYRAVRLTLLPGHDLPALRLVPDELMEALLYLIAGALDVAVAVAHDAAPAGGVASREVTVCPAFSAGQGTIRIGWCPDADAIAARRLTAQLATPYAQQRLALIAAVVSADDDGGLCVTWPAQAVV